MPDFVVVVSVPSRTKAKNVLVLDADNGFHAQVAAYMFVVQPLHPPAVVLDITCATSGGLDPQGPLKINERVNARIYNPDPYRDFPRQEDKPDSDQSSEDPSKEREAAIPLRVKIEDLYHCIKKDFHEDALGHLFDLLHHVAPDLVIRGDDGKPNVAGLEDLAKMYGQHPAPLEKEEACESE